MQIKAIRVYLAADYFSKLDMSERNDAKLEQ